MWFKHPEPSTWAEYQRGRFGILMAAGGMFYGLCVVGIVLILWRGGWQHNTDSQRLTALTLIALGLVAGSIATTIALAIGGPVGRFKGSISRDGASLDAESDAIHDGDAVTVEKA